MSDSFLVQMPVLVVKTQGLSKFNPFYLLDAARTFYLSVERAVACPYSYHVYFSFCRRNFCKALMKTP
jgi:hypothetical protein